MLCGKSEFFDLGDLVVASTPTNLL
jgi:hypothetical protein